MTVLLIEDDIQLNTTIKAFLEFKGYEVTSILDGEQGMKSIDTLQYDLYIIDINLPNINGLELVAYIRNKDLTTPIVMITASLEINNLKTAFQNGCNDYIKKPFHLDELDIRIHNLLDQQTLDIVNISPNIVYDLEYEELKVYGEVCKLRKKERRFLTLLIQNINHTISHETIENYVWENEIKESYPIRQLVTEMKKHFKDYAHLIESERGKGYKIIEEKIKI